jgi:hypothetical protein
MKAVTKGVSYGTGLNAICPYFTMFPLQFPYGLLRRNGRHAPFSDCVLDPFCGRGTTNFAARLAGLPSIGVDCNAVAVAATKAKLTDAHPDEIVGEARAIIETVEPDEVPTGEFWDWAYHPEVLQKLCRLRMALLRDCWSRPRIALRGILLGALHGPMKKVGTSYLSNQSPRTYAPKPNYAVRFWSRRELFPPKVDLLKVVAERARRFYGHPLPAVAHTVKLGDSREPRLMHCLADSDRHVSWIITSPPYYGLDTYLADQWLRFWFLGGEPRVNYSRGGQISHNGPEAFIQDLRAVWSNLAAIARPDARLVIRFGGINERRHVKPLALLKESLHHTPWRTKTIIPAGSASRGRRQAETFFADQQKAIEEHDLWARLVA